MTQRLSHLKYAFNNFQEVQSSIKVTTNNEELEIQFTTKEQAKELQLIQ